MPRTRKTSALKKEGEVVVPKSLINQVSKKSYIQSLNEKDTMKKNKLSHKLDIEKFSYIISHDLQEPLRQITGFLNLLEKSLQNHTTDEKINRYIQYISDATARMQKKLEGLKSFIEARQIESLLLKKEEIQKIIHQALLQLNRSIQTKKAKIEVSSNLPQVFADRTKLKWVFFHLIENALKFVPENRSPIIYISGEEYKEEFSIFHVKDSGIGIASKYFDKIFSLFQRLHPVGVFEGVGTGLSIAKEVIENHGGEVTLTSKEGEGSEFSFTLPRFST